MGHRELSLALEILVQDAQLFFVVPILTVKFDVGIRYLLVVDSQCFELLFGRLAPGLDSQQPLFFEAHAVLIFVDCEPAPVDVEVLILVLPLVVALEPFKVLHVLLFKAQFEILKFSDLLLVVMDSL